ncbi:MAG: antibiotic biosynthesis monooxygenase [Phyllobacteriaceae bacterium]|jgi:antibiotic biosynthesis monooxygenase (ABM) superfamily enzyme|nr:antibiotic biosynthesis monooxygenase [Phyllobacteriaceae bacterium]
MMGEPVTVVVRRHVRPGSEAFYEDWLDRLTSAAGAMPGYLGSQFQKPASPGNPYVSIFRFDSLETLDAFERSELRARYLREIAPHVASDAVWDRTTGLEVWFEAPKGTVVAQPSPHRMALVLVAVVFVLVLILNVALDPIIGHWPLALRLLVTVVLQVLLMTYLIMPRVTRWLARWIFPSTKTAI